MGLLRGDHKLAFYWNEKLLKDFMQEQDPCFETFTLAAIQKMGYRWQSKQGDLFGAVTLAEIQEDGGLEYFCINRSADTAGMCLV